MANTKISNLTAVVTPDDTDRWPVVQNMSTTPVTKYQTGTVIKAWLKTYFDTLYATVFDVKMPDGFVLNGKFVVTIASNNITVTLTDKAGSTPSASSPVYVWINGTKRSVTAALSVTVNAAVNTFDAGSTELAAKEIDYFVYLGWKSAATAAVVIGFSRIPWANIYSDFSGTATNEKYAAFSTAPAATDDVVVIGRLAATLSAGAGYTWTSTSQSAPTTSNTIQFPIFETRTLTYLPVWAGGSPAIVNGTLVGIYRIRGRDLWYNFLMIAGSSTTFGSGTLTWSLPFTSATYTNGSYFPTAYVFDASATTFYLGLHFVGSAAKTPNIRTHGAAGPVTSAVPITLATSDQIGANGVVVIG